MLNSEQLMDQSTRQLTKFEELANRIEMVLFIAKSTRQSTDNPRG